MKIRRQPIISTLLGDKTSFDNWGRIYVPQLSDKEHFRYLFTGLMQLMDIRKNGNSNWGLPVMLASTFEEAMKKRASLFYKIDHKLFQEFYKDNECGILLSRVGGTTVYYFAENKLYVWCFTHDQSREESMLGLYFIVESTAEGKRRIYSMPTLLDDDQLFVSDKNDRYSLYENLTNWIITYLAVRKYGEVEETVVPPRELAEIGGEILEYNAKEKGPDVDGQEVLVLDSRWFRRIVNDNDISVRAHFRLYRKNMKLVLVRPFIRHGYHRNAKIDDSEK